MTTRLHPSAAAKFSENPGSPHEKTSRTLGFHADHEACEIRAYVKKSCEELNCPITQNYSAYAKEELTALTTKLVTNPSKIGSESRRLRLPKLRAWHPVHKLATVVSSNKSTMTRPRLLTLSSWTRWERESQIMIRTLGVDPKDCNRFDEFEDLGYRMFAYGKHGKTMASSVTIPESWNNPEDVPFLRKRGAKLDVDFDYTEYLCGASECLRKSDKARENGPVR